MERRERASNRPGPAWFVNVVALDPGMGGSIGMRGGSQAARVEVVSHPMFALARLWDSTIASFLWLVGCSVLCVLGMTGLLRRRLRTLNYIVEQAMDISRREVINLPALPKTLERRRVEDATKRMVTQLKALVGE